MKTETLDKISKVIKAEWPNTQAEISQLEFEGAYWFDEGTHVALMVWCHEADEEVVGATIAFDLDGNLTELEECFNGLTSLILDDEWM